MVDHTRSDQNLDRDIEQVGISEMCLPLSFVNSGSVWGQLGTSSSLAHLLWRVCLSVCLSESSSKFIWRIRAKFWLRVFRALCLDGVKMFTSCSRIMRAPRDYAIWGWASWQCRLFCAQSWFCMHNETSDRELSLVVGYWLIRFKNSVNITLCGGYECWEMSLNPISSDIIGLKLRVRGRSCLRLL